MRFSAKSVTAGAVTIALAIFVLIIPRSFAPVISETADWHGFAFRRQLLIDQFGYRPADTKVTVRRTQQMGFDAADGFSRGARFELLRAADGQVVFAGAPAG